MSHWPKDEKLARRAPLHALVGRRPPSQTHQIIMPLALLHCPGGGSLLPAFRSPGPGHARLGRNPRSPWLPLIATAPPACCATLATLVAPPFVDGDCPCRRQGLETAVRLGA